MWRFLSSRGSTSGRLGTVRRIVQAIHEEALYDVAAGLTFYALLALVPFLLLCLLLVGVVLDEQSPETVARIVSLVAPRAEGTLVPEAIQVTIHGLAVSARGGFLIVAIGAAAWTASKVAWALVRALNRVFHTRETRPLVHQRVIALAATSAAGVLAAAAVVVQAALPFVTARLPALDLGVVRWLRIPVTAALSTLVWTALYRLLPAHPPRRGIPSVGSMVGVAAWMVASWGFAVYLDNVQDLGAVYGSFGGILVLLLWLWISCFALLFGALVDRLRAEGAPARGLLRACPPGR
jgi:membrane protein